MQTVTVFKGESKIIVKNKDIEVQEKEANQNISDLINDIALLETRKSPLIKCLKSPKLLIRSLLDLQKMVEMVDIKNAIVGQIKFLITNKARVLPAEASNKTNPHFEGHMLHTVISGNPGTGKTTVAMILAKIWMALGFIDKSEDKNKDKDKDKDRLSVQIANTISKMANENSQKRIKDLEEQIRNNERKINKLREIVDRCQYDNGDTRRKALRIRTNMMRNPQWSTATDIKEWNELLGVIRKLKTDIDSLNLELNGELTRKAVAAPVSDDPYENEDPKFIIASREDLVGEYLGHTAVSRKGFEKARGGVLFIDEAYSLCTKTHGSGDSFGEECLVAINEFMSLHPDEIIVIFAGYKEKLMETIFRVQPGLHRRISNFFEIKDYTSSGLAKIFKRQIGRHYWKIDEKVDIVKLLKENSDIIKDGGGGTERLSLRM